MELEQDITLKMTETECRCLIMELDELESITDAVSQGGQDTRTGLFTRKKLRGLLEAHGLGSRPEAAIAELAWLRDHPPFTAQPLRSSPPFPPGFPPQYPPAPDFSGQEKL